jgi:hypothetical protein
MSPVGGLDTPLAPLPERRKQPRPRRVPRPVEGTVAAELEPAMEAPRESLIRPNLEAVLLVETEVGEVEAEAEVEEEWRTAPSSPGVPTMLQTQPVSSTLSERPRHRRESFEGGFYSEEDAMAYAARSTSGEEEEEEEETLQDESYEPLLTPERRIILPQASQRKTVRVSRQPIRLLDTLMAMQTTTYPPASVEEVARGERSGSRAARSHRGAGSGRVRNASESTSRRRRRRPEPETDSDEEVMVLRVSPPPPRLTTPWLEGSYRSFPPIHEKEGGESIGVALDVSPAPPGDRGREDNADGSRKADGDEATESARGWGRLSAADVEDVDDEVSGRREPSSWSYRAVKMRGRSMDQFPSGYDPALHQGVTLGRGGRRRAKPGPPEVIILDD